MTLKILAASIIIPAFIFSCSNAPKSDEAKTTEAKEVTGDKSGAAWTVDNSASKIEWIGTKVSGYHTGDVPLKSGQLFVNNGEVTGGTFVMDIANMKVSGPKGSDTADNRKLLTHLKSSDFFDVAKHPEAKFELTGITAFKGEIKDTTDPRQEEISEYRVTNPTHTISGNLTIKGVSKNIEFPAKITVNGDAAEAVAKFNINRKDWGIVYEGMKDDLIRDMVHFGIRIVAKK
jgi:polyisoprenoid-binding protein YceI